MKTFIKFNLSVRNEMSRTLAICQFFGKQGGTVHQIGQETGIDTTGFIYDPADLLNDDYLAGWNAGYEHDRQKAAKNKGNVQFWIGVADGWSFKKRTEA